MRIHKKFTVATAATAMTVALAAPGGAAASTASENASASANAAQAGCVLTSMKFFSTYNTRNRERYIIFKPAIRCSDVTSWKVTLLIRRQRFGPDKGVADKQQKGRGSKSFILGTTCSKGKKYNADFYINIMGGPSGGTSAHRVKKGVKCV